MGMGRDLGRRKLVALTEEIVLTKPDPIRVIAHRNRPSADLVHLTPHH